MTLRRLLKLIIALTVTAGLLSAPSAALAFAGPQASVAGDMHAMDSDMQAMSTGLSCCRDGSMAGDCDGCPLMALCMLSTSTPVPAEAGGLATRDLLLEVFSARDDAWVQGLAGHPPDHPPRSNV